ncbi:hypothetical protein GCM10007933_39570 [Zoogloea oryzae]|uniref:histidine kinase n=1 Tax=Zoogloea oryzae TaxID=310767 RepID=A0ABQ6FI81_9RHOO|nr:PAS domain S-box protein [Zoogloea oryzae]GLT24476.1 hypothetical protein GCM10007933_39570 [Zoogloea oryzae]
MPFSPPAHIASALFVHSPEALVCCRRDGEIVAVNKAACRLVGYGTDGLLGHNLAGLSETQPLPGLDTAAEGAHWQGEFHCRRANGPTFIAEFHASAFQTDAEGLWICLALRDITGQRHAEQRLRASDDRHARVLEGSNQGFWEWNLKTGTFEVSARFESMLGFELGERDLSVSEWPKLVHPDDFAAATASIERHLHGHAPFHEVELRCLTKDGSWKWVLTKGRVVEWDTDGSPLLMAGTHSDISERKRVEAELNGYRHHLETLVRQRSAEIDTLYNQAPCGYHSIDIHGQFVAINDTELRMLGYRRDEVIGKLNIRDVLAPHEIARFERQFAEFIRTGRISDVEFDVRRKDGSELPVRVSAELIRHPDGSFAFSSTTMSDNRERKAMDAHIASLHAELQRRAAEAEAANKAKSAFLANMSHEIRTPLNAIIGMTHLLNRTSLDARQAAQVGKIDAAGRHLLQVINDILDISKIEADRLQLEQIVLNPAALLHEAAALMENRATEKSLRLNVEAPEGPPHLIGDPTRLRQALLNFASNAIKFTDRGRVTLRLTLADESDDDALLRFEVEDTGPGIAPEVLASLFSAFEQGDNATTRKHGGTGLGLVIARRLAELMGGEAGANSTPGVGSVFWFTARLKKAVSPLAQPEPEADNLEALLMGALHGAHVLLAEDEPVNQEIARELLGELGLVVDVANDGLEAVTMAAARQYALILMDMQMPGLDGLSATREIRAAPWGRDVPIIAMTANAFSEDRQRCTAAGMNDFLSKPVEPALLYATVVRWLRQH